MTTVVGAVLVGGASSRMGTPKALLPLDDTAMARRVVGRAPFGRRHPRGPLPGASRRWQRRSDRHRGRPVAGRGSPRRAGHRRARGGRRDDVVVVVAGLRPARPHRRARCRLAEAGRGRRARRPRRRGRTSDGRRHPFPSAWRVRGRDRCSRPLIGPVRGAPMPGSPRSTVVDVAADRRPDRPGHPRRRAAMGARPRQPPARLEDRTRRPVDSPLTNLSPAWRPVDVPEIDIAEAAPTDRRRDPVIDVREPDEYVDGHVPGAPLIPLGDVPDRESTSAGRRRGADHLQDRWAKPRRRPSTCGAGDRRRQHRRRHPGLDRRRPPGRHRRRAWLLTVAWGTQRVAPDGGRPGRDLDESRCGSTPTRLRGHRRRSSATVEAFGIDTEFHRERTYYPQLALVQLSWDDQKALVDPLAVDLGAVRRASWKGRASCVMHAASQDLEVLDLRLRRPARDGCSTPSWRPGSSGTRCPRLAALVERVYGVHLPKGDRLTDWLRRPLGADQRRYAASDVEYLLGLERSSATSSRSGAGSTGRSTSARCCGPRAACGRAPDDAWLRIKEARTLRGEAAAVARSVAAWRERRAAELDQPVRFVCSDLAVVGVAQRAPEDARGPAPHPRGRRAPRQGQGRRGRARPRSEPAGARPAPGPSGPDLRARPPPAARGLPGGRLGEPAARDLEIETSLVATRADIEALLAGGPLCPPRRGWRAATGRRADPRLGGRRGRVGLRRGRTRARGPGSAGPRQQASIRGGGGRRAARRGAASPVKGWHSPGPRWRPRGAPTGRRRRAGR